MKLPYDPAKAYEPVALIGTVPHLLVVGGSSPFTTGAQLVAAARDQPGSISFASGGNGSPEQLAQRQAADSQRWGAVIREAGIKLD